MTQQQKDQLIKELEKLRNDAKIKFSNATLIPDYYRGQINAYRMAIKLLNQTTVNRSSTEPKFIEG